jgi:hypothetical protein
MRLGLAYLAPLLLAALPLGCTKATVIGTPCMVDKDCNVKDQVCAPGFNGGASICTRKCTANTGATGCPIGYDCFPTDAAKGMTCNKSLYEVDAVSGKPLLIGVDCSSSNDVCTSTGSAAQSISCRRVSDNGDPPMPVDFDPNAYCTATCATDADCPLDFVCEADFDMQTKCLRRTLCTPCTVDGNCGMLFPICVPTADGSARYCSKTCGGNGDCGGVSNTALTCAASTSSDGSAVMACLHRAGRCVGEGNICDPCRFDTDCAKSGSSCLENIGTLERFCTKSCTSDATCAGGAVASACDNKHIGSASDPNGMSFGFCNGDVNHDYIAPGYPGPEGGLFSCWLPQ